MSSPAFLKEWSCDCVTSRRRCGARAWRGRGNGSGARYRPVDCIAHDEVRRGASCLTSGFTAREHAVVAGEGNRVLKLVLGISAGLTRFACLQSAFRKPLLSFLQWHAMQSIERKTLYSYAHAKGRSVSVAPELTHARSLVCRAGVSAVIRLTISSTWEGWREDWRGYGSSSSGKSGIAVVVERAGKHGLSSPCPL